MILANKKYDVAVVGGGHAGCEAALASARMGMKTVLFTMDISTVAKMPCNPAIGGLAKGHLVREIDALGGEMGKAIDDTGIQFRMLNRSKGPAVWSPRAQADKLQYALRMLKALEGQNNLDIKQSMVVGINTKEKRVTGVKLFTGAEIDCRAVVLTTGTFLNGLIHIGLFQYAAGRDGEFPAIGLTEDLVSHGFATGRLKTGTPPRIDGSTVDLNVMEIQNGDEDPRPFSYQTEKIRQEQVPCYLTKTTEETHRIIRSGLDRSPLYTGKIIGVGPRYCPSVEVKIVRFPDKTSHQLYLEPEGLYTNEYYLNGFATSLSEDVQLKAVRSVAGLENAELTRLGYAIEYDYFYPSQLNTTMETKDIDLLYFAGQINGTSGYEEAAAQGMIAGINASLKIEGKDPFVLKRSEAYIGVLTDDLVTKEIREPYRMFTSLAEHRLSLRQDNADMRLMDYGREFGLIDKDTHAYFVEKRGLITQYIEELKRLRPEISELNRILNRAELAGLSEKESIYRLLKRPGVTIDLFMDRIDHPLFSGMGGGTLMASVRNQVEIDIKYEGYLNKQRQQIEKMRRMEDYLIPEEFNYEAISSLSAESSEKLQRIRPRSVAQASRIAGVSPSDIAVLLVHLKKR
ncbi:MAG: tRNA uridine-5-carboxymethylaminomethyl(34) synthesis enzyme MnmG [candidate division KSB1 bacterium]|jgi:tRNA uridine 5-carboxymethylaminomethyl modification enzyme|nr:tRNA uridine-5-carboxymethylaminomethyl(34) synthesis enzyme MnmG [candidate division KSB1 bacterium]